MSTAIEQLAAMAPKVNSPELAAMLQAYGPELYADAEFVNLLRVAMLELHEELQHFLQGGDATPLQKGILRLAGDFDASSTAQAPKIVLASLLRAGISKLYNSYGANEDGAMTQKAASSLLTNTIYSDSSGSNLVENMVGNVTLKVYTIPKEKTPDGVYLFWAGFTKTLVPAGQTGHLCNFRAYISESPITQGSVGIGGVDSANTTGNQPMFRKLTIYTKNGETKILVGNQATSIAGETASAYPALEYAFDHSKDHYVHILANPINSTVKFRLSDSYLQKL